MSNLTPDSKLATVADIEARIQTIYRQRNTECERPLCDRRTDVTNAQRPNTFYTFAGQTRDQIRAARAAHMSYARNAPQSSIARLYAGMARACTWELVRRANVHGA